MMGQREREKGLCNKTIPDLTDTNFQTDLELLISSVVTLTADPSQRTEL